MWSMSDEYDEGFVHEDSDWDIQTYRCDILEYPFCNVKWRLYS